MIIFENLEVYKEAVALALDFYRLTRKFPKEEMFGLVSQIRRAAVSISLNIAEGSSRGSREFSHFLNIARGSCYELIPLLKISLELGFILVGQYEEFYNRTDNLAKRISALKKSVNR